MRLKVVYITRACVCMVVFLLLNSFNYEKESQPTTAPDQQNDTAVVNVSEIYDAMDRVFVEASVLKGYLVYNCDDQHLGYCGGWSDRMSGMFSAYVISVILRKHFLIQYTRSSNLTDYLIPNTFDWRYNSSILTGKSSDYHDLVNKAPNVITTADIKGLQKMFSKDVNFVRINWDYTLHFRRFPGLHNLIPWLFELHFADIYLKFFHTLFKPTKIISETVNKVVQHVPKLACAHIRMGGSETIIGDNKQTDERQLKYIWNLLMTMKNESYHIFLATDAEYVRDRAKALFKHILEADGRILHVDWGAKGEGLVGGYRKVVVDFLVLTKCDVLVLTKSGFGIMSSYLNTKVSDQYCLTIHGVVVPCSRYNVHSYFPGDILSPI
ncbi:uncharacterized protein LOC117314752 [Pecten maximus]|uniref:uncharacterized protein LOC117314752 n=1 Tax=Pecten maximus TaxID=6579 RepID=UPI001458BA4E|nr:uncharacterized protein LOC117314752 [Pecten maximus]